MSKKVIQSNKKAIKGTMKRIGYGIVKGSRNELLEAAVE